jgi:hypothetical protein
MPMSVEANSRKKAGDKRSSSARSVDLLCSVKYKNNLPDVPFGPKFLSYPFDSQRYIQYNPTSLERNHDHELLTEVDLGVPIDLVLPETYDNPDPVAKPDLTDEALLEEEVLQQPESKRCPCLSPSLPPPPLSLPQSKAACEERLVAAENRVHLDGVRQTPLRGHGGSREQGRVQRQEETTEYGHVQGQGQPDISH